MYHPAVALYNPTLKDTLMKDFLKLKKSLDGEMKAIDAEKIESNDNESIQKQTLIDEILKL